MPTLLVLASTGAQAIGTGTQVVSVVLTCVFVLAFLVFFFTALSGILRSGLSGGMKVLWVIFAFCAPFIGCLAWFFIGSKDTERRVRA
jgi:hypothetical protein